MSIYADSSFMVALHVPHDNWHRAATGYYEKLQDDTWLWSPWHRVEVFNTIRQLVRHPDSRRSVGVAEARSLINRIDNEIRLGYFLHMEADWRDVIRTASEISVAHAFQQACPGTDLLHVAYAVELAADLFVTFDDDQAALAKSAGLKTINPSDD